MKKVVCTLLIATMMALSVIPAYAADVPNLSSESTLSPNFIAIMSMSAGLDIKSSGKVTCSGLVTPSSRTYSAELTVSLQKSTNNGWSTVRSWTATGEVYDGAYVDTHYYVTSGTYRVRSTAKIYNSSGTLLETESMYSAEKTY